MTESHDEESIRRALRELTEKTRKLREELRGMVTSAPSRDLTRALIHTQSWPTERRRQPGAIADERRATPRKKNQD